MSSARRALVSVSDKSGLAEFVGRLVAAGFEIVSTGGTRKMLADAGHPVVDVTEVTGFPEIMGGRVKTLHPLVHGGLLGRPDLPSDAEAIAEHGIVPFEIVVCNLYPFEATVAKPDVRVPEAVEQIDIGGPSMIRSAAKNHAYVGVVTSPDQYDRVATALEAGPLGEDLRRELAVAAFRTTAAYDAAISSHLAGVFLDESPTTPSVLNVSMTKRFDTRYGENPHQPAAFYAEASPGPTTLAAAVQRNGKELSYNNLLDLDAALGIARDFDRPAVAVLKHNNPCGCAVHDSLERAFLNAWDGDPVSAFGSIVGVNRVVDAATAEQMVADGKFIEAVIAPGYADDAFEILTTRPKWGGNVRLMELPDLNAPADPIREYRRVSGGLLVQARDESPDPRDEWKVVTDRAPSEVEYRDLEFVWQVTKHVKSNAIVFATGGMVVGVGAGQMSRLDSAFVAAYKAGERSKGAVLGSDAFFPFRDGVDQAAEVGIAAIVQPGGSRRDEEVIAACNEHGMAMVFTGRRHFRH